MEAKAQRTRDIVEGIAEIKEQLNELANNLGGHVCVQRICPWDNISGYSDFLSSSQNSLSCAAPKAEVEGPKFEAHRSPEEGCTCVKYERRPS